VRALRSSIWRRIYQLDEILVSIVPVILGSGARLFDNLGDPKPKLEQVEAIEAPGVTHIRYARV
jgi:dihydrofolate reductase